jgi:hypothetical protein
MDLDESEDMERIQGLQMLGDHLLRENSFDGQPTNLEANVGSYLDFFTRRSSESIEEVFKDMAMVEKLVEEGYELNDLTNPEVMSPEIEHVRDFIIDMVSTAPRTYSLVQRLCKLDREFWFNIMSMRLNKMVDGSEERTSYYNLMREVYESLMDNVVEGRDIKEYEDGRYYKFLYRNLAPQPVYRKRGVEDIDVGGKRRRVQGVMGAPETPLDSELKRLYDYLCFFLEPTHDFTKARATSDEEPSKGMKEADKTMLKNKAGKFAKGDVYIKRLKEMMGEAVGRKSDFTINGVTRDFMNPDELDSLLKIIEITGMDKRTKVIRFKVPVMKVVPGIKGEVAEFNSSAIDVNQLIQVITRHFPDTTKIYRDAKGTVLIKHLEGASSDIKRLRGDMPFAEKMLDGAGPSSIDEKDDEEIRTLKVDYKNQIVNAPGNMREEVVDALKTIVETTPGIFSLGETIGKKKPRKFILRDSKEIEFGPSVKDFSTIMKYFMNAKNDVNVWAFLNLKRAGDHGQAERARVDGGVFETLDHLAAAYSIMIEVPTIVTYSDKPKGIVGDFLMVGTDVSYKMIADLIENFTTCNSSLCVKVLNVERGNKTLGKYLEGLLDEYRGRGEMVVGPSETLAFNTLDLCSCTIQLSDIIENRKKEFGDLFKPSIKKFRNIIESAATNRRKSGAVTPPFKDILDLLMTARNFTKYMSAVKTLMSVIEKLMQVAEALDVKEVLLLLANKTLLEIIGLDDNINPEEFADSISDSIALLLNPKQSEGSSWTNSIRTLLGMERWLDRETLQSIITPFNRIIEFIKAVSNRSKVLEAEWAEIERLYFPRSRITTATSPS